MKVAILAGGVGSRIQEETDLIPKPMITIGGRPILWHIMKLYDHAGYSDFVIALGYKGEVIKRYIVEYCNLASDLTVSTATGKIKLHEGAPEDWSVQLIDTGLYTNTGGRIKKLESHLKDDRFFLTWGDGVSDVDLSALLDFHVAHGKLCTMTAVRPVARFGHMELDGNQVVEFSEKPQAKEGWINGAFFVCEPGIFDFIGDDDPQFEHGPLEALAKAGQLMAYPHEGFWQCMDTLRDRKLLEEYWESGNAPWQVWAHGGLRIP